MVKKVLKNQVSLGLSRERTSAVNTVGKQYGQKECQARSDPDLGEFHDFCAQQDSKSFMSFQGAKLRLGI